MCLIITFTNLSTNSLYLELYLTISDCDDIKHTSTSTELHFTPDSIANRLYWLLPSFFTPRFFVPSVEHTAFNTSSANSISLLVGLFCISTSVPLAEALLNELKCKSRHKSRLVHFLLIAFTTDKRLSASASLTTTTPCSCSFCVKSLRNCMASSASL